MSPGIGGAQAGEAALGSGDNARTDGAIVTGLGSLAKRISGSVPKITNGAFLKAIFGDLFYRAHVTSFADSPDAIAADRSGLCWAGRRYGDHGPNTKGNTYFTVSLFKDLVENGKVRHVRRKAMFEAGHCVVVDDVGTKVRADDPRLPPPSWRLETSPGNSQWGYILATPETDQGLFSGLLSGMVAKGLAVDGTDPGMKGATRYVRLPQGRNLQTKYLPDGFECRLTEWAPDRKFTLEQLGAAFGLTLDDMRSHGDPIHGTNDRDVLASSDALLKTLADAGMYLRKGTGGWHDITCPWVAEHTDGDDSGTGLFVGEGRYGFQCFHGHHIDKTARDLFAWMEGKGLPVPGQINASDFESFAEGEQPRTTRRGASAVFFVAARIKRFIPEDQDPRNYINDGAVTRAVESSVFAVSSQRALTVGRWAFWSSPAPTGRGL